MKNLNFMILKALEEYDIRNRKYRQYIKDDNISFNRENLKIKFNSLNKEFNYQNLGAFDTDTNLWIWAWMMPMFKTNEIKMSKELLNYGLKNYDVSLSKSRLDRDEDLNEDTFLKIQLVNSRFLITRKFQLDLLLSMVQFLLKDKILFIYKRRKELSKGKYIEFLYLLY